MHKQVSGWTVNFGPNFPESPFLELKTRKPPPPFRKTSDLGWPKFTPEYPPPISKNFRFRMTKVYSGIPPHFGKLQIWDDQSLLWNTPPLWKLSESPSPGVSEYRELLHVETLSNPDNYKFRKLNTVPIILVPNVSATSSRFLLNHLRMIMVQFSSQQLNYMYIVFILKSSNLNGNKI